MVKLLLLTACALAVLTGCPDVKAPKDPPRVPTPKAASTSAPAAAVR
jgi:hypothetical protein